MKAKSYQQIDWYDTPHYYDLIFDVDSEREADFLEELQRRYGLTRGKRVFEPACGSGRLMVELARRGWQVSGSDLSQPMLDYAKERLDGLGLKSELRCEDMAHLSKPPARRLHDLAHCFVSTFKYLLTEKAACSHLEGVVHSLKPGGIYALGFHMSDYAETKKSRERWVVKKANLEVVCNIQGWPADRKKRLEDVRSRLRVVENGVEKRNETCWRFRTYDRRQVLALLRKVPALEHLATFDFHYDIEEPLLFGDTLLDVILVLRRRK